MISPAPAGMFRPLVIVGAGGHAVSVANVALSAGYQIRHFVDQRKTGADLLGVRIIGSTGDLGDPQLFSFAIAIGDNAIRERFHLQLNEDHGALHYPALIHASAVVSHFTSVGEGTVVMPHAVIGPNTSIGKFCLVNTRASIDHDSAMLDFSSLAPGATTGGTVTIGRRSAVSIGATIKHGVKMGDDSVLGASSYLNRDLADNQVAYGTPAKPVRSRQAGDSYLA